MNSLFYYVYLCTLLRAAPAKRSPAYIIHTGRHVTYLPNYLTYLTDLTASKQNFTGQPKPRPLGVRAAAEDAPPASRANLATAR